MRLSNHALRHAILLTHRGSVGQSSMEALAVSESRFMVGGVLGADRAAASCEQLGELMLELLEGKGAFKALDKQDLLPDASIEELAGRLNAPVNLAMRECEKIFSTGESESLFGIARGEEITLVEPDILREIYCDVGGYTSALQDVLSTIPEKSIEKHHGEKHQTPNLSR